MAGTCDEKWHFAFIEIFLNHNSSESFHRECMQNFILADLRSPRSSSHITRDPTRKPLQQQDNVVRVGRILRKKAENYVRYQTNHSHGKLINI